MKAIIEFNLPEDQEDFDMFNQASNTRNVIWEMTQWLRGQTKYAPDNTSEDTIKAFYECQDKLNYLLNKNNVELL
jgi:hypothetical protein